MGSLAIDTTHSGDWNYASSATSASAAAEVHVGNFTAPSSPGWLHDLEDQLASILNLQAGWDSYGADRPDDALVAHALDIFLEAATDQTPAPQVIPLPSGGIQLEWHCAGIDIEMSVERFGAADLYVHDREGRLADTEIAISQDLAPFVGALNELTLRTADARG